MTIHIDKDLIRKGQLILLNSKKAPDFFFFLVDWVLSSECNSRNLFIALWKSYHCKFLVSIAQKVLGCPKINYFFQKLYKNRCKLILLKFWSEKGFLLRNYREKYNLDLLIFHLLKKCNCFHFKGWSPMGRQIVWVHI